MFSKKFRYFGYQGVLQTQNHKDSMNAPLLELNNDGVQDFKAYDTMINIIDELELVVANIYKNWSKGYGYFGDIIEVIVSDHQSRFLVSLNFIARLAYHKPCLASDILPFIIDKQGHVFFVGIIRKHNPGKGKFAFTGGVQNFIGYELEAPAETAIREADEEIGGLDIAIHAVNDNSEFRNIMPEWENVTVNLNSKKHGIIKVHTELRLLGKFRTSSLELNNNLGHKRVDLTTAYLLPIYINQDIDKTEVASWFTAADDAKEIKIIDYSCEYIGEFAFEHHAAIYNLAVEKLLKLYPYDYIRCKVLSE
jgi:hypothetical protein